MTTKAKNRRVEHVAKADTGMRVEHSTNGIYQVDSGQRLYEMAKKIADLGLSEYIISNPPPPPFRRSVQ